MNLSKVLTFVLLMFMGMPALAQLSASPQSGITPFTPYQHSDIDSVNLSSGNVNLHIPIVSFPQAGGNLTMDFTAVFNQSTWLANLTAFAYSDPSGAIVLVAPTPNMPTV